MSPSGRPNSRRNSSGGFKPYTRGVTPITLSSIPDSSQEKHNNLERPGFPSYAQYKQVEAAYLHSLTPRRQGKALISQALFDRIWDVLHQPDSQGETAQFRFWARKMFTVSKTHRVTLGVDDAAEDSPQEVLLHDNLLVAIQEQLYDLLCYCHGSTGHGGRDKTCALIRKHYTWVPKDLVSNFIKACPTCIMKKCGNVDGAAAMAQITETRPEESSPFPGLRDFFQQAGMFSPGHGASGSPSPSTDAPLSWPLMGGPTDSPLPPSLPEEDPLEAAYREALLRARGMKNPHSAGVSSSRVVPSYPMVREVSLYKGLPNGWQYRHNDYASAHAEFMRTKDLPPVEQYEGLEMHRRPRVPSIAPLWGPDKFPNPEFDESDMGDVGQGGHAMEHAISSNHGDDGHSGMSLQYLLMASEQRDKDEYIPHIDPLLMGYSESGTSSRTTLSHAAQDHIKVEEHGDIRGYEDGESVNALPSDNVSTTHESPSDNLASSTNFPSSSSLKRAAVPLRIDIDFPNERTFQALLAYRESMEEGNVTPDSPLAGHGRRGDGVLGAGNSGWRLSGNPSPASSSSSSSSSGLSAFPMSSTGTTPGSSALTTPVDECTDGVSVAGDGSQVGMSGIVVKGKDKGKGKSVLTDVGEDTLSRAIEAACGI